jgi:hypothetical protein
MQWRRAKFVHTFAASLGIEFASVRKLDDLVKAAGITANQAHTDGAELGRG